MSLFGSKCIYLLGWDSFHFVASHRAGQFVLDWLTFLSANSSFQFFHARRAKIGNKHGHMWASFEFITAN